MSRSDPLLPATRPTIAARVAVILVSALLAAAPALAATKIYRTVDEDGNVVFTDVPPKEGEAGQAVDLSDSNSFQPPPPQGPGRSVEAWLGGEDPDDDGESGEDETAGGGYSSLAVASPANDAGVRDNAGNVTIIASVQPDLQASHAMQVFIDGQLRQTSRTTTVQLTNLDRGTHNVELRIVDQAGVVMASSPPSTFHLQRRSVLLQPARSNNAGGGR